MLWEEIAWRVFYVLVVILDSGLAISYALTQHFVAGLRVWIRRRIRALGGGQPIGGPAFAAAAPRRGRRGRAQFPFDSGPDYARSSPLPAHRRS